MSRVLAIGDVHEPVSRRGYLQFCKDLYDEWDCDSVVLIGDVADNTAISFHAQNPEAPGPKDEYEIAKGCMQRWYRVFPNAVITIGNHDSRPTRAAESAKIPAKFIRDYNDLWETPTWNWVHHTIIDKVYYCHGHGKGGGNTPAFNNAKKMGMSVVMGHFHSRGGVTWACSPLNRWFGMDTGCGVDDTAYAFAYAKEQTQRSVLGAGVVLDGIPYFEPMPCAKGERYHDSNFKR